MWLTLLIAGLLVYFLYYSMIARRRGFPPGPTPWPIVGNLLQLDPANMSKSFAAWGKLHGGFYTAWIPAPLVVMTDFDLMRETIIKQGDVFAGRPELVQNDLATEHKGKHGIAWNDGPIWKEQRRFALHVLRDFGLGRNVMQEKVMMECRRLIEWFQADVAAESAFDPTQCIEIAVGSIINNLVFAYAYGKTDEKPRVLKHLLDESLRLSLSPGVMILQSIPWLQHLSFLPLGIKELIDTRIKLRRLLMDELDARKRTMDLNEEPVDYATAYMREMKRRQEVGDTSGGFNDHQLLTTIADLWAAGMETTVTTLRWAIAYMINFPDIQEKVHSEIAHEIGLENEVTFEDKNRLPFVQATINEIQRCGNLVPLNIQRTVMQDVTVRGYTLKKGTWIVPQISSVMSDPAYFKNPESFDPQRFIDNSGHLLKVEQLVPFSLGKRVCLGESLARMELFLIFTTLMQQFQFLPAEGIMPSLQSQPGVINQVAKYRMRIRARLYSSNVA